MIWDVDLHELGLGDIADKALHSGHFYSMTRSEIQHFESIYNVPRIMLFNALSREETDPADIRVYGGEKGKTALMWNKSEQVNCRESFELSHFPFDWQDLTLEFRLNDPRTWDDFSLTFNSVQFHRDALTLSEWRMFTPLVTRGSPKDKVVGIKLQVKRNSDFYLQNVVAMMTGLTLLGVISFAIDVSDIGSRISTILTLILTAVAFKFVLSNIIPKVSYNTLIDYFMLVQLSALAGMAALCIVPSFISDDSFAFDINKILALLCVSFIVSSVIGWMMYVRLVVPGPRQRRCKQIQLVNGKNWYNCRFSTPMYLPEIEPPFGVEVGLSL
jgi:hypothetical protein